MAADDQDQGYVPLYTPKRTAPAAAPAVAAPAPAPGAAPNEQGYVPLYQKPGAGQSQQTGAQQTTGGGPPGAAQPGDWSSVAWNEAMMKSIPGLRAQAEAARQRLGPLGAASADVAGNFASPTTALNFVPYVGPELAGGLHEGIKSYNSQPDWFPSLQGWEQIGKDAAGGVAGGALGHAGGAALSNPELLKLGAGGLGTMLAHQLPPWFPGQEVMGAAGGYTLANKAANWTADQLASPAAQQAIRSLALGGTAVLRNSSPGPLWDQWVPAQ